MNNILIIQLMLLLIQISSFVYALKKGQNPIDTHFGISIYMCLPIVLLNFA